MLSILTVVAAWLVVGGVLFLTASIIKGTTRPVVDRATRTDATSPTAAGPTYPLPPTDVSWDKSMTRKVIDKLQDNSWVWTVVEK